ncbi:hypothetical protein [uncultured Shewanella sp.]|uniref:hypothetical protein n=1 Tax=uncultured Shewanella sp. TaxID=173975 RepID=UPI00260B9EB0|nr:hypothetical protein [uncultured Shewanella sp.]
MRNNYKIIDYREIGIPSVEVSGAAFHYQDLYEIVGKSQFMTTFELRVGSLSHGEFGHSLLGVVFYDRGALDSLVASFHTGQEVSKKRIRVDSPNRELSDAKRGDLKYRGINVEDIESISFLPYREESKKYDTGEKKVPNVIEVKVDCSDLDTDILNQNYLVSKHNSGVKLVCYEKEQLIGITLAFNNGSIDSRIISEFGVTEEDLKTNLNIWLSFYKVKERRGSLTELDKTNFSEIKSILAMDRFNKIVKELNHVGITNDIEDSDKPVFKSIFEAVEKFSPSIILHGKKQVYWDVDSYIHLALRHLKDYQLGNFKQKTPFPYKSTDLKSLIEKVLYRIKPEIEVYLASNPTADFTRHGKMAVVYNKDHYHLRINPEGRLVQLHTVEPAFNKSIQSTANASADSGVNSDTQN